MISVLAVFIFKAPKYSATPWLQTKVQCSNQNLSSNADAMGYYFGCRPGGSDVLLLATIQVVIRSHRCFREKTHCSFLVLYI